MDEKNKESALYYKKDAERVVKEINAILQKESMGCVEMVLLNLAYQFSRGVSLDIADHFEKYIIKAIQHGKNEGQES